MKYTVVWLPGALGALANLWMHSSDPQEVQMPPIAWMQI